MASMVNGKRTQMLFLFYICMYILSFATVTKKKEGEPGAKGNIITLKNRYYIYLSILKTHSSDVRKFRPFRLISGRF